MEYIENQEVEAKQLKAIFADMLKYSPSKICGMLGNAIIVPIYTSLLTPGQYGLYSISIALLSFLCIIFSDWVGLSGLRFFKRHQLENDLPRYMSTLVTLLVMNLCVLAVLAFLFRQNFYDFFNIQSKYFLAILVLIIPVAVRALLSQLLRAQLKSLSFTLTTILNQFLTIGLSIFIIKFYNLGAMSLLLGMGISITLIDILLIYQSEIWKTFKFEKIQWDILLPLFTYGIPIAATSLTAWIINQSNKFIMNSIHGFSEVGIVGVAYGLTLPLFMTIFSIITTAAIPRIIVMYEEKIDVRPIISRFAGYFLLLALPAITVVSLYSSDYVNMLSSDKFHSAFKLIPYFAFGTFFMALADYTTLQYHLANKTYIDFIIKLISGITNVLINIALIPKMGLVGVGIATLSANFLYFFLSSVIVLPNLRLHLPLKTIVLMLVSFIPAGIMYYLYKGVANLSPLFQMISIVAMFYFTYWAMQKALIKLYR